MFVNGIEFDLQTLCHFCMYVNTSIAQIAEIFHLIAIYFKRRNQNYSFCMVFQNLYAHMYLMLIKHRISTNLSAIKFGKNTAWNYEYISHD